MEVVVHIAGPYADGLQVCTRCGKVLTDYRGAMVVHEFHPWPAGGYVGCADFPGGSTFSVLLKADASALDEVRCDQRRTA